MLQESVTASSLIKRICKFQATFFVHAMRREKLDHLVTTGMSHGKQLEKMLDEQTLRLKVGRVADALKATRGDK